MVRGRSEDRGQPAPPPSVAVEGHRLSFVLLEALDFDFEGEPSRARSCARAGGGWRRAEARLDPALSSRPGRGVDSVAPPHTESAHTMPRGKRPLVFGQWSHVGSDTAFALRRCRIQPEDAGRGA